jgi:hypothetical protein
MVVTNIFYFTNSGNAPLEISDVNSSCGCTAAANYSRHVEPGQSGFIPVFFNTSGMGGGVAKSLKVSSNDASQPELVLRIAARVWKPIDAFPGIAAFSFGPDFQTNETRVIRLVSNLEDPVKLSDPVCTNASFRAQLKTVQEGKEFELDVSVVPPLAPGSITTPIIIKTSSSKMPFVRVSAFAMVQPAIVVQPSRIILSAEALAAGTPLTVQIQNRSTNTLVLSEPVINSPGATVELRELQPGRIFSLGVTFPAKFRLDPTQDIEVRIKSNHPQMPYVKVPVFQPQLQ